MRVGYYIMHRGWGIYVTKKNRTKLLNTMYLADMIIFSFAPVGVQQGPEP
jgi:hypothetical protein